MKKLNAITNKAKMLTSVLDLFRGGYLSEDVYVISKELTADRPCITLWMSDYDYRHLIILTNGSGISVLEVENNTVSFRSEGEIPEGTEKFKYIAIS